MNMILLKQRPVVEQLKMDLVDLKNMFGWKLDQFAELDKKVKKVEPSWYTVVNKHIKECCKQDEQHEILELQPRVLVEQLDKEIEILDQEKDLLKLRGNELFDCLLLRNIKNSYIPDNDRYQNDLRDLKIQLLEFEEKRDACFKEFNNVIPQTIVDLRDERRANRGIEGETGVPMLPEFNEAALQLLHENKFIRWIGEFNDKYRDQTE